MESLPATDYRKSITTAELTSGPALFPLFSSSILSPFLAFRLLPLPSVLSAKNDKIRFFCEKTILSSKRRLLKSLPGFMLVTLAFKQVKRGKVFFRALKGINLLKSL